MSCSRPMRRRSRSRSGRKSELLSERDRVARDADRVLSRPFRLGIDHVGEGQRDIVDAGVVGVRAPGPRRGRCRPDRPRRRAALPTADRRRRSPETRRRCAAQTTLRAGARPSCGPPPGRRGRRTPRPPAPARRSGRARGSASPSRPSGCPLPFHCSSSERTAEAASAGNASRSTICAPRSQRAFTISAGLALESRYHLQESPRAHQSRFAAGDVGGGEPQGLRPGRCQSTTLPSRFSSMSSVPKSIAIRAELDEQPASFSSRA